MPPFSPPVLTPLQCHHYTPAVKEISDSRAAEDDIADLRTALAVSSSIEAGAEELVPAAVADRLIDGTSPLTVWREHRSLSQAALSRASGVNRVQIADIEADRATGSARTLRALADALRVTVDDLLPA